MTQLVNASEADAALGYMARLLALCSLPRTNPGNRLRYVRRNGPYTLIMTATGTTAKLPYGILPRLPLAWVSTEAVRTQSATLTLGDSLSAFMRKLGIYSTSCREHMRLRNQMRRLFKASVSLTYEDEHHEQFMTSSIASRFALNQELDEPIGVFPIGIEVMTELRPREDAAVKADRRDPLRLPALPAKRFQCSLSPAQVLDHGSPNGPLSPRLQFCQIGPRRQGSAPPLRALDRSGPI